MHIRAHLIYSFLAHTFILMYLLSLPLHRTIIQPGLFETYFVYLRSEGDLTTRMPSLTYMSKESRPETYGRAKDTKTTSITRETDVNKDNISMEAEKEVVSEKEPEVKVKELPVEKPVQVAKVKETLETQRVEEAPKEVHKTKAPETKEATMKAFPMPEKSKEPEKPQLEGKPNTGLPDLPKTERNELPVTKEAITIVSPQEKLHEKTIHIEKLKKEEEPERTSELKKKETLQEKIAPPVDVKEKEPEEPLKVEEAPKEALESGGSVIKEGTAKIPPLMGKIKEALKIQAEEKPEKGIVDAMASSLKGEPPALGSVTASEVKKPLGLPGAEKVSRGELPSRKGENVTPSPGKVPSEVQAKGKSEAGKGGFLKAEAGNKMVPSAKGLREETVHPKDERGPTGQISTSEKTILPPQEGHFLKQDEGKIQPLTEAKPGLKGQTTVEEKKSGVGIPVSEALFFSDLKIEVFLRKSSSFHAEPQAPKVKATATTEQKIMPKATKITNISLEESNDIVKVQIKGNGSMTPKVFSLENNRIVIDIPNVVMNTALPSIAISPLKGIRSGKHKDKSRIVLELNEKMPFDVSAYEDSVIVTVQRSGNKPSLPIEDQKTGEKIEAEEPKGPEISNISMQLFKKIHPMANKRERQTEVAMLEENKEPHSKDKLSVKRAFSISKTDEGTYTFVIKNQEAAAYEADLVFFIFQGKKGERIKKFTAVELSPHAAVRFKFILPEALFWDDDHYFSGKIENSDTMTKFNEKTGLIWKETKDE